MDEAWTGVVLFGFLVWFGATVANQFTWGSRSRVARFDALHLLPRWTFFAPNPGRHDIHVVFRDCENGECAPWRNLGGGVGPRLSRWAWNPSRFERKAVNDLANALLETSRNVDEFAMVLLSSPYLGLLQWVMQQTPETRESRQFAIVASEGFGDSRLLHVRFVSERHPGDA